MFNWRFLIGVAAVLLGTVAVGVVHGRLTNRWGIQPNVAEAAERLSVRLPGEAGNWRLRSEEALDKDVQKMLQCPAHVSRVYEHQQTGDVVRMFVIMGPPGPVSVHTPEVCYSSRDYSQDGVRESLTIEDKKSSQHTLWQVMLKPNAFESTPLRVLYAWSTGNTFTAAEMPRFKYGGLPHLYKIQLAVTELPSSKAIDFDAGKDFLQNFLPQLAPQMVEARHFTPSR